MMIYLESDFCFHTWTTRSIGDRCVSHNFYYEPPFKNIQKPKTNHFTIIPYCFSHTNGLRGFWPYARLL